MSDPVFNKGPRQIDLELETAFSQKKSLILSNIALMILLIVLLAALFVLIRANTAIFPRQKTVFTSNAAAVCSFTPITDPGLATTALIENFASNVAQNLHMLDYVNYRSTLSRVMDVNFTPEARAATTRAMLSSGILRTVTEQGFVLRALPDDRPAVLVEGVGTREVEGVAADRYTWVVRVPLLLAYAYRGAANTPTYRPEKRDVYMTIVRTEPTAANPMGLQVAQLVAQQPSDDFDISIMSPSLSQITN